jgi:hypothetical protein
MATPGIIKLTPEIIELAGAPDVVLISSGDRIPFNLEAHIKYLSAASVPFQ